jgi:hypothetical protein
MTRSCGAAALLLLSTTATTCGFVVNPVRTPAASSLTLHATTEVFQRSLLAAQIANNNNKRSNNSAPNTVTTTQSVDYDAAARLAYESSGSNGDFATFRAKYLQDTSALVATKQRTRIAKEKAAAAKEKAQKAAEAAQLAKEKAQAKIREKEVEVIATASGSDTVTSKRGDENSSPATAVTPTPPKIPPPKEEASPEPVVASAAAETSSAVSTTESSTKSSTKGTQFTVPRELALVPINESTVQFTAGTLGALAGLLLGGGPFLAIFLSATANYLSRKDDEPLTGKDIATYASPKRIVDTASQTALLIYNFLAQFERDNKIVDGTFKLLEGAVERAKQSEESGETIVALESTLGGVAKNIEKLNEDFDLVGGAGTVLNSVGDLVENSVDKVVKLNEEYKLTDRVGGVVKGAVAKVTEKKE